MVVGTVVGSNKVSPGMRTGPGNKQQYSAGILQQHLHSHAAAGRVVLRASFHGRTLPSIVVGRLSTLVLCVRTLSWRSTAAAS